MEPNLDYTFMVVRLELRTTMIFVLFSPCVIVYVINFLLYNIKYFMFDFTFGYELMNHNEHRGMFNFQVILKYDFFGSYCGNSMKRRHCDKETTNQGYDA